MQVRSRQQRFYFWMNWRFKCARRYNYSRFESTPASKHSSFNVFMFLNTDTNSAVMQIIAIPRGRPCPYPNTSVPSFRMPNWAFWTPPLFLTSFPSLTTLPKHTPVSVLKKPPFWATRHFLVLAVTSTISWLFCSHPPGPPGSKMDTVLSGSWTTVMWPLFHPAVPVSSAMLETNILDSTAGEIEWLLAAQVSWVTLPWPMGWQSLTWRWECDGPWDFV